MKVIVAAMMMMMMMFSVVSFAEDVGSSGVTTPNSPMTSPTSNPMDMPSRDAGSGIDQARPGSSQNTTIRRHKRGRKNRGKLNDDRMNDRLDRSTDTGAGTGSSGTVDTSSGTNNSPTQ